MVERPPIERPETHSAVRPSNTRTGLATSGIEFLRLCRSVREQMGAGRFRHSAGVARMAEKLARRHGASTLKARVAGMLHDVARSWNAEKLLTYAAAHGIVISPEARAAPVLLHAPIAADIAKREFGIGDPETLGAIARHTVAGPEMSVLEKVVYLADSVEPSRTFADRAALEAAAFASLDQALLASVKESMRYLMSKNVAIAAETVALYDDLVRRHAETA